MRPIFVFLLLVWAMPSSAQSFRVATWQVDRVPSARAGITNTLAEEQRFNEISAALAGTEADVIILYGVSETEAARKVTGLIKPRKYTLAHHVVFRHGGSRGRVVGQAAAILSRRETMNVKTIGWDATGRIDMAGGFGFAVFRHGPSVVCLYLADLPGSLTNSMSAADGKYYARKRNYAAQYLAHHASWLAGTYTNQVGATYLTGDFQLAPKGLVTDECAKILDGAGFRALGPGVAVDKSAVSITNCLELDRVQDPVFTRGVEFIASRQVNPSLAGFPLVVCDLTLKSAGTTAKATVKPPRPPAPAPKPAPVVDPEPVPAPPPPVIAQALPNLTLSPVAAPRVQTAPSTGTVSVAAPASSRPNQSAAGVVPSAVGSRLAAQGARAVPDWHWLWWLAAAAFGIGLVFAPRTWSFRRKPAASPSVSRRANETVYLELQPARAPDPKLAFAADAAVLHEVSTATGHADEVRWRKPGVSPDSATLEARMMPQLKRVMRDRLVGWLARQRTTLLTSQEQGTEQVLDLQARLETIKQQFQNRMQMQQQRIAELDAALRAKEKVILELLRFKPPER